MVCPIGIVGGISRRTYVFFTFYSFRFGLQLHLLEPLVMLQATEIPARGKKIPECQKKNP